MRSVMLRSLRMPATADNSRPPAHTQGGRRACEAPGQPLPSAPEEGAGMVTTFQPTTASAAVEGLPQVFDPAAAAGIEAVILFDLSGREPGQWTVVLHDGTCRVMHGRTMEPTVTLVMDSEIGRASCRERGWGGAGMGSI